MKQLLVLLFLLCSASVCAQDVIVKKDGSTVICRIVELNATEIVYKKWSDLNGSNYIMDRSLASAINYENGRRETFGEVQSQYQPHNQNDGVQQYNDRALLKMDADFSGDAKKIKTLKTICWTVGPVLTIGGAGLMWLGLDLDHDNSGVIPFCIGAGLVVGGITCSTSCLMSIHRKKSALASIPLYQQHYNLGNNSSLTADIDMFRDLTNGTNTLGLGIRYNF